MKIDNIVGNNEITNENLLFIIVFRICIHICLSSYLS